ncbi:MAG: ATP-binding protein [Cyanobacteria bacterium P01_D01_bin.73]
MSLTSRSVLGRFEKPKSSIFLKLVISFSLLSSAAITVVAVMAYGFARESLKESTFERLNVAVALKDDELGQWLETQRQDVLLVSQLPGVRRWTGKLMSSKGGDRQKSRQPLAAYFKELTDTKPNLRETSILTEGGIITFSTTPDLEGRYQPLGATTTYFTADETKFRPTFYQIPESRKTAISFATPILDAEGDRLGALSISLDLEEVDELVGSRAGLGKTGETYLVGSLEGKNQFLFSDQQRLNKHPNGLTTLGVEQATQGKNGQGLYTNYDGVPVLGVYRWLGDRNLALLAEISQEEAFSPARELARQIFLIGLFSILVLLVIVYLVSRYITQPIQEINKLAIALGKGDFTIRAPVTSHDEVGTLARSLNQTADLLLRSQKKLGEYNEKLQTKNQRLESTLTELQVTQSQLIQSEKMSSLGQMIAGIAHEINNPVSFVHGNLDYAAGYLHDLLDLVELYEEEYPSPTEAIQEKLEEIEIYFLRKDSVKILNSMRAGTERIRDIVISLRNFARLDESSLKEADLHEGIESTILILSHRTRNQVEIVRNYGELPLVKCYPAQLNQVFMNILHNALDAMGEVDLEEPRITIDTKLVEGDRVSIRIENNGPSIPKAIQNKLFNPFFTTKAIGKGTGIGLGICYQIVDKHNGMIEIDSEIDSGAAFIVTLPIDKTLSGKVAGKTSRLSVRG